MNDEIKPGAELAPIESALPMTFTPGTMPTALALYLNDALFERVSQIAVRLSKAEGITPRHLLGQVETCFAVVSRAITWHLDPFAVAMATYQTPGGSVGFEGKLVLAILENSGRLATGVRFEHYGDWSKVQGKFAIRESQRKDDNGNPKKYAAATWTDDDARAGKPTDREKYPLAQSCGVRVIARVRGETEPRQMDFDLIQAQPRNSTLWATDPKTQICYTAARRFANSVVPSLMMGVPFDPLDNLGAPIDVTPQRVPDDDLMPRAKATPPVAAPAEEPAPAPAAPLENIDRETGEILHTAPNGAAKVDQAMTTPATNAQRQMIRGIAKRNDVDEAALDAALIDRFAVNLAGLPMGLVNEAIQFTKDLRPAVA